MEKLQPERHLLSTLEPPTESMTPLLNELKKIQRWEENPNDALGEVKGVSGVNDSGKGDTDYLEYTTYAKAIMRKQ